MSDRWSCSWTSTWRIDRRQLRTERHVEAHHHLLPPHVQRDQRRQLHGPDPRTRARRRRGRLPQRQRADPPQHAGRHDTTHLTPAAGGRQRDGREHLLQLRHPPLRARRGLQYARRRDPPGERGEFRHQFRICACAPTETSTANPLFMTATGPLRSRVLDGGDWSALNEATFIVDAEIASDANLAITEIHYRPLPPTPLEEDAGFNEPQRFRVCRADEYRDQGHRHDQRPPHGRDRIRLRRSGHRLHPRAGAADPSW